MVKFLKEKVANNHRAGTSTVKKSKGSFPSPFIQGPRLAEADGPLIICEASDGELQFGSAKFHLLRR